MKEKLTMPCTEQQWEQEIKPRIEKTGNTEEQPKWMPLTRGGIRVKEVIKFGERLAVWGINEVTKNGSYWFCGLDGLTNGCNNDLDLIPYNHEIEAIKKEIAIKEKELEQLKGKLK